MDSKEYKIKNRERWKKHYYLYKDYKKNGNPKFIAYIKDLIKDMDTTLQ